MENENLIREIAIKACREVLQDYVEEIAEDVARRMKPALAAQAQAQGADKTKSLCDGTQLIAGARTQTEVLESLVAAAAAITSPCGLLIVRGAQAVGWTGQGFASAEIFRQTVLDCSGGVGAKVLTQSTGIVAGAGELGVPLCQRLGLQGAAQVMLVPVRLKERVAAVLLGVARCQDDLAALEVLVNVAQLTLELQPYRKNLPQAQPASQQVQDRAAEPKAQVTRPEAVHVPPPTAAGRTDAVAHGSGPMKAAMPPMTQVASAAVATAPAMDEAHEKARRFAKLLVEEIKLYNQAKVAEGRARGDLYSRLQEDIEKSRAAYQKRYGETVKDVDFFTQELLRILADNNRAAMGPGFPG